MSLRDELIDAIEYAGYEPRGYSGRFMYGKYCVATAIDDPINFFLELEYLVDEYEELELALSDYRIDTLGLNLIVYWPNISWEPKAPPEPDVDSHLEQQYEDRFTSDWE